MKLSDEDFAQKLGALNKAIDELAEQPKPKPRPISAEESRELAGHFNAIANAAIAAATFMGEHAFPMARIDDARSIADRARHAAGELEAWAKHLDQGWRPV